MTGLSISLSFSSIIMTMLEFSSVVLFLIGGFRYCKTTEKKGLAMAGVISACVGGLPNAIDKLCWTFFSYDTWFNSTWMFFFVGIGLMLLFFSALEINKVYIPLIAIGVALIICHNYIKYCAMLITCVGMFGFYITMFRKTKDFLYIVSLLTSVFLIVWSVAMKFTSALPNIIAQMVNSSGYVMFIIANNRRIKEQQKNSH